MTSERRLGALETLNELAHWNLRELGSTKLGTKLVEIRARLMFEAGLVPGKAPVASGGPPPIDAKPSPPPIPPEPHPDVFSRP